jgi:dynein heavy chain
MEARMSSVLWVLISAGLVAGHDIYHMPTVSMEAPDDSTCPPNSHVDAVKTQLSDKISDILSRCGGPGWKRVAYLNMRDPNQTCPEQWRLYEDGPLRACGRLEADGSTCDSVLFSTGDYAYDRVCGRITGYMYASPDTSAGSHTGDPDRDINRVYLDGVSITRGKPRKHVWSFYAGVDTGRCCGSGHTNALKFLGFIGNDSFCDSGNPDNVQWFDTLFTEHPLWDGEAHCHDSSTCCTLHAGPWFHTELKNLSMDDIEVRVCGDQPTHDEDTPVERVEIYVK